MKPEVSYPLESAITTKYVIEASHNGCKYWAKLSTDTFETEYIQWQGLKDNATLFDRKWQAEGKLSTARASTMMKVGIKEING